MVVFLDLLKNLFFIYSIGLILSYFLFAFFAYFSLRKNKKDTFLSHEHLLLTSNEMYGISIIAPAFNEEKTIVENVRSLLSLNYLHFEVIIVNDGSDDHTLTELITVFDLIPCTPPTEENPINTKQIKGYYKSQLHAFDHLKVIDKCNGGKADALNAGINASTYKLFLAIDVDCVLDHHALIKMVKPFLKYKEGHVIATGGVVRIINSCEVKRGKIISIHLPKNYLAMMQTLAYIRSFALSRIAWNRLNALLIVSGAFGAFDKSIVKKVGGYSTYTVGEDMELLIKMKKYMYENKLPFKVEFVPDPLCWTEAPSHVKNLISQRDRWMRGTIESLMIHKNVFFNPTYGVMGLLSFPYWFLYEMLAPIIETMGYFILYYYLSSELIDLNLFFTLLLVSYIMGFLYSTLSVFMEVRTFNKYLHKKDLHKLIVAGLSEPFYFHLLVTFAGLKGHIKYFFGVKGWGANPREGFSNQHNNQLDAE